jgi:hypothetical protein
MKYLRCYLGRTSGNDIFVDIIKGVQADDKDQAHPFGTRLIPVPRLDEPHDINKIL